MPLADLSHFQALTAYPGAQIDWDLLMPLKAERDAWYHSPQGTRYAQALAHLPPSRPVDCDFSSAEVRIGRREDLIAQEFTEVYRAARALVPWRKGPFNLFGTAIDAEWRSDLKWERIAPLLGDLHGKSILDVGGNNGYFLFRMGHMGPKLMLGIDPVLHCHAQFRLLQHFAQVPGLYNELLGVEHVGAFNQCFDVILCMGVIYHHRDPVGQLEALYKALRPGGLLVLESLGLPSEWPYEGAYSLQPAGRYANMKNVWNVPTPAAMLAWAERARFEKIELAHSTPLGTEEQRSTDWSAPVSLAQQLDAQDPKKTVEGHPAPWRYVLTARRKWP